MATGEVYELVWNQSYQGQPISNVFHFQQVDTFPAGLENQRAQAVASAWFQQVLPDLQQTQTNDVLQISVTCRSLWVDAQKHDIILTGAGGWGGGQLRDTLPRFNAYSFVLTVAAGAIKGGFKRLCGVPEEVQIDGILSLGAFPAVFTDAENSLAAQLVDTATQLIPWANPVVLQRVRTGTPGNYSYRLPRSQVETVAARIIDAAINLSITSQISRKG